MCYCCNKLICALLRCGALLACIKMQILRNGGGSVAEADERRGRYNISCFCEKSRKNVKNIYLNIDTKGVICPTMCVGQRGTVETRKMEVGFGVSHVFARDCGDIHVKRPVTQL